MMMEQSADSMPVEDVAEEMDEVAFVEDSAPESSEDEVIVDDIVVQAAAPEQDNQMLRIVEAMLFASSQPLTLGTMRERMPEGADVGGLLLKLQNEYEGRGVTLVNLDGSWAFRTAGDLGDALQLKREVRRPLSRAAMETLAIVAYHQPVTRAEIENIRGVVTSGGTLDILMEQGWVKPGRRREAPGRPLTWVTTTDFLDQFGLQALTDLPGLDELKASGLLDRRPAIDATTADMFEQIEDAEAGQALEEEEAVATEEELAALKEDRSDEDGEDSEEMTTEEGTEIVSEDGDHSEESEDEDSDDEESDDEESDEDDSDESDDEDDSDESDEDDEEEDA
jgi:segregation and condensation protein B